MYLSSPMERCSVKGGACPRFELTSPNERTVIGSIFVDFGKAGSVLRNQRYLHPGSHRAGVLFCAEIEDGCEVANEVDLELVVHRDQSNFFDQTSHDLRRLTPAGVDREMELGGQAAISAGEDILPAYQIRIADQSLGDEIGMKSQQWPTTPGTSVASFGSFTVSSTRHSCS